ncbi:serine-rich adhesin for platelets [Pieris brassicae]|uniref:Tyrosine-protein phosphatase domain-containing protein n=1 Tax=Pieris brassicae TaxID=7116 RepID=A0A9P0T9R8_PIEBR|nr:serine-rich adhesin for platelets [Pieris brassicae]XP_045511990.1 serine-rich adhesin for platelets [Pieris brassicae]XP_045511991.1 serine-rich adhesin for platelets [Pieris brassicae]CAH4020886.1 unnamed protein product [Pieris brassicae]
MESPVRICLGVALVVNLLLLSSTQVNSHTLPHETTPTIIEEKNSRNSRVNVTWVSRGKPKLPDVASNELQQKDVSDENSDKNSKFKARGRVRFNPLSKSTTESSLRRIRSSTEASNVIIVTPTPEVKKPMEIIDSMHNYKKTKLPISSTFKTVFKTKDEDDEESDSYERYTSSKFNDNNYFTFNENNFSDKEKGGSDKQNTGGYNTPSFHDFPSYFTKQTFQTDSEPYKFDKFFDFDSELTTPKNYFFDKKYHEVSSSIQKNLESKKPKATPLSHTTSVQKVVEKLSNGTPHNQSRIIMKNSKEVRVMDNDEAGTNTKALSDVQGTSIYYEMSVLSTETYNISLTNDEDDCDNDESPSETTKSTPQKEELAAIDPTQIPFVEISTPSIRQQDNEIGSTVASYFLPGGVTPSVLNTATPFAISFQNTLFPSERLIEHVLSSSEKPKGSLVTNRNRNYSKRLNLNGKKESANNVDTQNEQVSPNLVYRQNTRRFHYTTPKIKPVWIAPRRNITRMHQTKTPATIYSEHFDIKNKYSTEGPAQLSKILTTLSSDIDPVLQSDFESNSGKRVVHSHSFVDNTIPSLWKRGSTKFSGSSSSTSSTTITTTTTTDEPPTTEARDGVSELEIPPTLTAWALAGMRSPPSLIRNVNRTSSTKTIDENELQKVGEIIEKRETTTSSTTSTTSLPSTQNQDYSITKNITEIDQNRLPWKPFISQTLAFVPNEKTTEPISERVPAESNISLQSSEESSKADFKKEIAESQSAWVATAVNLGDSSTNDSEETLLDTILPAEPTRSTGFESITKLPSDMTTPSDDTLHDTIANSDENNEVITASTKIPDFEITTIRFSYIPTDKEFENTEVDESTADWYYAGSLHTKPTTIDNIPITTYRPKYYTTSNDIDETTSVPDTTPQMEVFSQTNGETTKETTSKETISTESMETTTSESSTSVSYNSTKETIQTSTSEPTTEFETTSIVITVSTEINTKRAPSMSETPTTIVSSTELQSTSENNDNSEVFTLGTTPSQTQATTTTRETTAETTTSRSETITEELKTVTEKVEMVETITGKVEATTEYLKTDQPEVKVDTTTEYRDESTMETTFTSKIVNELEDLTSYGGEMTTEASSRVLDEAGSGAAIAIAVSTIGVIALVLLIGLLLVVRRRGRRGVYAQRCTPVSLDAYSLDSVSVGHRKGNQRLRASKRSYGNPAYDDEVTSHPMNYAALANFALDIDSITAEFSEIPTVTVRPEEVPPGCEDKNRYSNVLPLPETRVPLKRIGNDSTTEYINANYVTGPGNINNYYIACQAPLSNTVVDFWRMIWEQNSRLIVMLTEYMENGVEKCFEYLPPSEISDNRRTFGEYQIILKKREQRDKYAISAIQLINLSTRTWREVTHLWYFWPAKGVPDDYDSVIDFLSEMRSYMKISQGAKEYDEEGLEVIYEDQNRSSYNNLSKLRSDDNSSGNGVNVYSPAKAEELLRRGYGNNGTLGKMKTVSENEGLRPCTVVCASGAGRSAALIAADICARALASGSADLPRTVRALRTQRPHSLTNRHHYIFLYKLLSEYGNRLMGGGIDTI